MSAVCSSESYHQRHYQSISDILRNSGDQYPKDPSMGAEIWAETYYLQVKQGHLKRGHLPFLFEISRRAYTENLLLPN